MAGYSGFSTTGKELEYVPYQRKSEPESPAEYPPISVLPILSKVYEKVFILQITTLIENEFYIINISLDIQRIISKVKDGVDKAMKCNKITLLVFVDFSKFFDTIDFNILIPKVTETTFF